MVEETNYAPGLSMATHHHAGPTLSLIFAGGYLERFDGGTIEAQRFTAVMKPAGFAHANDMSSNGLHALYAEPTTTLLSAYGGLRVPSGPVYLQSARVAGLVARASLCVAHGDSLTDLTLESCLLELTAAASEPDASDRIAGRLFWLERVADRLRDEFNGSVSIQSLVAESGVHPVHLVQAFRQRYGCTIGDYVRALRVRYVMGALRGHQSIGAIALDAGFSDHSHLTRVFRRAVGMTPTEYRRTIS